MAEKESHLEFDPREVRPSQGPATGSLDAAVEYLRQRGLRLAPIYVLAMLPMSAVALLIIDALAAQRRSVIATYCLWLLPATLWRWIGLARMQQAVQADIQAKPGLPLHQRIVPILLVRLYANVAYTWGGILVVPSFYGLFAGSFTAPLFLEQDGPMVRETFRMLSWVSHSTRRLARVVFALTLLGMLALIAVTVLQSVIVQLVLPSILGIDASSAALTMASWAWRLSLWYFVFLAFDFFWTAASVFLYFDSQSRRTGADLAARLQALSRSAP